jgi:hypothetical protein
MERCRRGNHHVGLSRWFIRVASHLNEAIPEAAFVGTAVVFYYDQLGDGNLGYRVTPSVRGPGRATEVACAAPSGAARVAPQILVSARMLT